VGELTLTDSASQERSEVTAFFNCVHTLRRATAARMAREAAPRLGIDGERLEREMDEAIGEALFGLFSIIDGVWGPDDFPRLELTLKSDGKSLNATFLHDLYVSFEPRDRGRQP
jgi:hypothetical protein